MDSDFKLKIDKMGKVLDHLINEAEKKHASSGNLGQTTSGNIGQAEIVPIFYGDPNKPPKKLRFSKVSDPSSFPDPFKREYEGIVEYEPVHPFSPGRIILQDALNQMNYPYSSLLGKYIDPNTGEPIEE